MIEARHLHLRGVVGEIRTAMYENREHIIVPVVALMEGVIHAINADTPEYVPIEALTSAPQGWNGRPVMFGHPTRNGHQISANDPTVLEEKSFGRVFDSRIKGKKLYLEAWLDPEKAKKIGAERLLERTRKGEQIEVSVGAFVVAESKSGEFNGKSYKAVWKEITPDHLAFLPHGVGACSIKMGCGTHRAAEEHPTIHDLSQDEPVILEPVTPITLDNVSDFLALAGARNSVKDLEMIQSVHDHAVKLGATCAELKVAAEGVMTNVQKAVAKVKAGEHTIEECVKEYGLSPDEEKQVRALVAEKPAEDKKKFDFGKLKGAEMTKELRAATIKALTECPCSGFTADDVKLLESVSDERLEAFAASTEARKEEQTKLTAAEAKVTETQAKVTETEAKVTEAEAKLKAAASQAPPEPKPLTEEEFMKAAPASIKSLIARQKKQDTERKDRLVTELKAAQSEFTEDELNGMDLEQLARIARVAKINELPDNYEGRGVPRAAAERKDDPFLNPPDPYAPALEQRRKGQSVN